MKYSQQQLGIVHKIQTREQEGSTCGIMEHSNNCLIILIFNLSNIAHSLSSEEKFQNQVYISIFMELDFIQIKSSDLK